MSRRNSGYFVSHPVFDIVAKQRKDGQVDRFDRKRWESPAKRFKALGHPVRMWIAAQAKRKSGAC